MQPYKCPLHCGFRDLTQLVHLQGCSGPRTQASLNLHKMEFQVRCQFARRADLSTSKSRGRLRAVLRTTAVRTNVLASQTSNHTHRPFLPPGILSWQQNLPQGSPLQLAWAMPDKQETQPHSPAPSLHSTSVIEKHHLVEISYIVVTVLLSGFSFDGHSKVRSPRVPLQSMGKLHIPNTPQLLN